ncbi:MAG: arylesterase [Planctomycetota bacterium]
MNRRLLPAATFLSLLIACAEEDLPVPSVPASAPPASAPSVAFMGDSITAGLHVDDAHSFSAVLQQRFAERGEPFRRIQAGVSGDTSAGGRRRIDWLLRQEPDVVVIELGGNDGLRGIPLDVIAENLTRIIERAQAADVETLLLGMRIPENYGEYAREFAGLYPRIAEETGAHYLDYFMDGVGARPEMNVEDQLHPNELGHARLADNLEPTLERILASVRQRASSEMGEATESASMR